MSIAGGGRSRNPETATCPLCGEILDFDTDHLARTVEICRDRQCPNHVGHAPTHDPNDVKPPYVPKKRRKYVARAS